MNRWKAATVTFWRTEPAMALGLYFLLAAAEIGYVRLAGGRPEQGTGLSLAVTTLAKGGSTGGLLVYAWFTWRMWLGGEMCWAISVLWKVFSAGACVIALFRTGSIFAVGLVVLSLLSIAPALRAAGAPAGRS